MAMELVLRSSKSSLLCCAPSDERPLLRDTHHDRGLLSLLLSLENNLIVDIIGFDNILLGTMLL